MGKRSLESTCIDSTATNKESKFDTEPSKKINFTDMAEEFQFSFLEFLPLQDQFHYVQARPQADLNLLKHLEELIGFPGQFNS